MSIVISIIKFPENADNTKNTHTFAQQGGTIGRGADNDWVLEDPERFISSKHTQITFENGQYYLTDISTNGTFFNGAAEPVGKGNTVKLSDGDKFTLGDYEFLASIFQPEQQPLADSASGPFADMASADVATAAPASPLGMDIPAQDNYFASAPAAADVDSFGSLPPSYTMGNEPLFSPEPMETDPLAALDKAGYMSPTSAAGSMDFPGASMADQADPMQQAVSWPDATLESGAIPEDWDDDLLSDTPAAAEPVPSTFSPTPTPVTPAVEDKKSALEKANEKILAEIAILKKQAQEQALKEQIAKNTQQQPAANEAPATMASTPKRHANTHEQSLIAAMGLDGYQLDDEKIIEISQVVGELVRETITGMMQVLSSRSSIKNEFRMNVTTIQPVENNPLKFSATVDDALENMFVRDGNAYKKPVEAIREGFEGIAEHQVAILAGIRKAFKGVLHRFDPAVLEQRFDKFSKGTLLPGIGKGKYWESYKHYYDELVDDMDNSFQHLFGYEFVQAYEDQLQKLQIARKTRNQ